MERRSQFSTFVHFNLGYVGRSQISFEEEELEEGLLLLLLPWDGEADALAVVGEAIFDGSVTLVLCLLTFLHRVIVE